MEVPEVYKVVSIDANVFIVTIVFLLRIVLLDGQITGGKCITSQPVPACIVMTHTAPHVLWIFIPSHV